MKTTLTLILVLMLISFSKKEKTKVGTIKFLVGEVNVQHEDSKEKTRLSLKDADIFLNDLIETRFESRCDILFNDGSIVKLAEHSIFRADKYSKTKKDERRSFSLLFGKMFVKVKQLFSPTDEYSMRTPTTVAAVRGTEFFIEVDSTKSKIIVQEGVVDCGNVEMLTSFDSFIDFVQKDAELFMKWKNKNNGEDFFKNDYTEFKKFQQSEMDAYQEFISGKKVAKDSLWVKSVGAGRIITVEGSSRTDRPFTESDLEKFSSLRD